MSKASIRASGIVFSYTCRYNHRRKDKNSGHDMRCVFIASLSVKPSLEVLPSHREVARAPPVKPNLKPVGEPSKPKASSSKKLIPTNEGSASSDRNLKELKSIHERTQVSQNIKLSGRRLLPQPKRKRQINPNFDIQFTDLKNSELDDASDPNGMEYDSDDLPLTILPVAGKEEPPPEIATSSKVTKTNKTINSKPILSSSRIANFVPIDDRPTKRVKTAHSSAVSICSYLY